MSDYSAPGVAVLALALAVGLAVGLLAGGLSLAVRHMTVKRRSITL